MTNVDTRNLQHKDSCSAHTHTFWVNGHISELGFVMTRSGVLKSTGHLFICPTVIYSLVTHWVNHQQYSILSTAAAGPIGSTNQ